VTPERRGLASSVRRIEEALLDARLSVGDAPGGEHAAEYAWLAVQAWREGDHPMAVQLAARAARINLGWRRFAELVSSTA
jgi:hypothetical protein